MTEKVILFGNDGVPLEHDGSGRLHVKPFIGGLAVGTVSAVGDGAAVSGGAATGDTVQAVMSYLLNPSTTLDRPRSAAASGAGLGVLKVHPQNEQNLTLLASAARTATAGTAGTAVTGLGSYRHGTLFLDVTAAATDVGDTLDVYVQYSPDGGTTWDDYAHFSQVLGNGGTKQYVIPFNIQGTPAAGHAPQTAGLAANSFRAGTDIGDRLRAYWVIVDDGGGASSFTFSLKGNFKS